MRVCCTLLLLTLAWPQRHAEAQCPIHLPFEIRVEMSGIYAHSTSSSDTNRPATADTSAGNNHYFFWIDSTARRSFLTFSGDSLLFLIIDTNFIEEYITYSRASIQFDTVHSVITTLSLHSVRDFNLFNGGTFVEWSIDCQNLHYFPDSITMTGMIPSANTLRISDDSSWETRGCIPPISWYSDETKLLSGGASIAGEAVPVLSVASEYAPSRFSVRSFAGALDCTFAAADQARELSVYTPIGVRVARLDIPAGITGTRTASLPGGLYFVRLDGSVVKIYVPE